MIHPVYQKQVIKAALVNDLINFANDVEALDLEAKIEAAKGEVINETENIVIRHFDLSEIYNRLNALETEVAALPAALIKEAEKALQAFKINIQTND